MIKKQIINSVFNSVGIVILIAILLVLKTWLFYHSTIAVNEKLGLETIVGTISFVVVIACLIGVLPNRARVIVVMIVDFFISLLLFGDHVYYIYSNSVLSVAQISNLQYGEEIINTLPMVIQMKQIFYFLDLLILIGLMITKTVKIEKKEKSTKNQIMIRMIVGAMGITIFCFIGVNYGEKGKQKSYNKDLQIREATIFGYHISDLTNAFTAKQQTKYKTYDTLIYELTEGL